MKKITNPNYRKFLDEGIIETIGAEQIDQALSQVTGIRGKHKEEGKCLLISLYYLGARPIEILQIKGKDITKKNNYILVKVQGRKRGLPRTIYLQYKIPHVKQLYKYATSIFPEMPLFHHYKNSYKRTIMTKKGLKIRIEETDKVRYYIHKWFKNIIPDSISPYFLRHNRFSKLSQEGVTDRDLQQLKGAKSITSVQPYQHMSTESAKKLSRKIK